MSLHNGFRDEITYDAETGDYYVTPPEGNAASVVAVVAVAAIAGMDPYEMEPAYDGFNLDVLDQVTDWLETDAVEFDGITVTIADHRVTILPDERLRISPPVEVA